MSLFRRRSTGPHNQAGGVDTHVVRELEQLQEASFTGCLEVVDRSTGGCARVFTFRGAPYAVALDGYVPDIAARLVTFGRVDADAAAGLPPGPDAGREAVRQGWIDAEELGDLHREIVIASIGAIARCAHPRVSRVADAVTDSYCTLPLPVGALVDSLPARFERLHRTWSGIAGSGQPSATCLVATGAPLPDVLESPEVRGLLGALAPGITADAAARRVGFTRAEAVHVLGLLAAAGAARVAGPSGQSAPADRLEVPEQFGERAIVSAAGAAR